MKLSKAIQYSAEKKARIFTLGIYIPFLSPYLARKGQAEINDILSDSEDIDFEIENRRILQSLILMQLLCKGVRLILENASKNSDEYKAAVKEFKEIMFVDYDKRVHKNSLKEKIIQLDRKIGDSIKPAEDEADEKSEPATVLDVVIWTEDVLDRVIARDITVFEFKKYYKKAFITYKSKK